MAKKTDPSITFLNKWGYNVVKVPRAGILPMQVLGNDGQSRILGPIDAMWTPADPSAKEPQPGPPVPASLINGSKTDALDIHFGLSILAEALKAFGATVPSLDLAYNHAASVQFSYTGVTSISVVLLEVGKYLSNGTIDQTNPVVQNYFYSDDAKAYLITDVLQSNSITVTATDSNGGSVGVDIPAIEGLVGANVTVSPSSADASSVTYTGPTPVTFGFAVQQLFANGNAFRLHGSPVGGDLAFAIAEGLPAETAPVLIPTAPGECRLDV